MVLFLLENRLDFICSVIVTCCLYLSWSKISPILPGRSESCNFLLKSHRNDVLDYFHFLVWMDLWNTLSPAAQSLSPWKQMIVTTHSFLPYDSSSCSCLYNELFTRNSFDANWYLYRVIMMFFEDLCYPSLSSPSRKCDLGKIYFLDVTWSSWWCFIPITSTWKSEIYQGKIYLTPGGQSPSGSWIEPFVHCARVACC